MLLREVEWWLGETPVRASLAQPEGTPPNLGVALAHGAMLNRFSLLREGLSLGGLLCEYLGAIVVAPSLRGEAHTFQDLTEIFSSACRFLAEELGVARVVAFGHSLGGFVAAHSLPCNPHLDALVAYGTPVAEFNRRLGGLLDYLVQYLSQYQYPLDMRNLLPLIFNRETQAFLTQTILKDPQYRPQTIDLRLNPHTLQNPSTLATTYLPKLQQWGHPTLILLGTQDKLTQKTLKAYPHNHREGPVLFQHLHGATHITPCLNNPKLHTLLPPITRFTARLQTLETPARGE